MRFTQLARCVSLVGVLYLLAGTNPATAITDSFEIGSCSYWKAGAEAPKEEPFEIRRIILANQNIKYIGTTMWNGSRIHGLIILSGAKPVKVTKSVDDRRRPLFPMAVLEEDRDSLRFLVPSEKTAFLEMDDGKRIEIMSGELLFGGERPPVTELRNPLICIRFSESPVLHDVVTDRPEELPPSKNELTEMFSDGPTGETSEDRGLSALMKSDEPEPARKETKGLADALTSVKPSVDSVDEPAGSFVEVGTTDKVCRLEIEAPSLALSGDFPEDSAFAVGLPGSGDFVAAYWYDDYTRELQDYGFDVRVRVSETSLLTISIPGDRSYSIDKGDVFPVQLVDRSAMETRSPESEPVPTGSKLRFLVFGDEASVALSGLDFLEAELQARGHPVAWTIDWYDVKENGALAKVKTFDSFSDMISGLDIEKDQVFLSQPDKFDRFVTAMEQQITGSAAAIDQVFWVKEGYLIPSIAPRRLELFIKDVHKDGNVSRRPDGRPYKWLQVIAGQYAQDFSRAYVSGPISTSSPEAGNMSVERREGARTVLLTDMVYPLATLENLLRRNADSLGDYAVKQDYDPQALALDSKQVFSGLGLVIDQSSLDRFSKSIPLVRLAARKIAANEPYQTELFPDTVDLSAIFELRTDKDGAVKGLDLDPALFARRVAALQKKHGEEKFEDFLSSMGQSIVTLQTSYKKGACAYYLLPDTALGLSWQTP